MTDPIEIPRPPDMSTMLAQVSEKVHKKLGENTSIRSISIKKIIVQVEVDLLTEFTATSVTTIMEEEFTWH